MMLSVDSRKNTWKLVSFERGVGVSIPNRGDDWLTHTYAYGGANLLMKTCLLYTSHSSNERPNTRRASAKKLSRRGALSRTCLTSV